MRRPNDLAAARTTCPTYCCLKRSTRYSEHTLRICGSLILVCLYLLRRGNGFWEGKKGNSNGKNVEVDRCRSQLKSSLKRSRNWACLLFLFGGCHALAAINSILWAFNLFFAFDFAWGKKTRTKYVSMNLTVDAFVSCGVLKPDGIISSTGKLNRRVHCHQKLRRAKI